MIDVCIVVTYLLVILLFGIWSGRNVNSMRDFAVSDRTFSTTVLVSTVFATCLGGDDLLGNTERAYSVGVIFLFVALAQCGNSLCMAEFVAPKIIRDFSDKIFVGEIMVELYGKLGRIVCGISNMLFSLGFVAVQITVIGYICNMFLGVSYFYGVIIGGLIVVAYSSFGGIRAVVFTDAIQFGVLVVGIPIIASMVLQEVGGFESLLKQLPKNHLDVTPSNKLFWPYAFLVFSYLFPNFLSVNIQRILISRDIEQAKFSFRMTILLYVPFYIILSLIGLCAFILYPGIDPNTAFLKTLSESLPNVVRGIAIIGVLSVIMSTADSFLNSAAISAVDDVAPMILGRRMSNKEELRLCRIISVIFGAASIAVGMGNFDNIIEFLLFFFNFWMPVVSAPMLLYTFGFVTGKRTYLISFVLGFCVLLVYRHFVSEDFALASQFVGMMATFFFMIVLGKLNKSIWRFSGAREKS